MSNLGKGSIYATGRRKEAVARVWIFPGSGKITINRRDIDHYFGRATSKMILRQPLELTQNASNFDVFCNVHGGGLSGQAEAIKLGLARALTKLDGVVPLRPTLKAAGYLTRDARAKERKKYGQRGARARFQFSKR